MVLRAVVEDPVAVPARRNCGNHGALARRGRPVAAIASTRCIQGLVGGKSRHFHTVHSTPPFSSAIVRGPPFVDQQTETTRSYRSVRKLPSRQTQCLGQPTILSSSVRKELAHMFTAGTRVASPVTKLAATKLGNNYPRVEALIDTICVCALHPYV